MKVILLILDGWGYSPDKKGNAIASANLPALQDIESHYPFFLLKASGIAVGLPWNEPGNSEVGHLTLGSGRVNLQAMPRIIKAIQDGSFFTNEAFLNAIDRVKEQDSFLHIMGLLGSGSVHSYIDHLYALLELAERQGISSRVRLHLFLDGIDSPPQEGAKVIHHLKMRLDETGQGKIASIIGRKYSMDRHYNWEKTKVAFDLLVHGVGNTITDEVGAIEEYYRQGISDSDIPPLVVMGDGKTPRERVSAHDSVIFFNYREDSARQLSKVFITPEKAGFSHDLLPDLFFVTMTEYSKDIPSEVAFKTLVITNTLAELLSRQRKTQLHIAEMEKYAHITYFFNGLKEQRHPGEEWQLVPSYDPGEYVEHPEFKVPEITQRVVSAIEKERYDFLLVNFANADLLGHTGDFQATVRGCEVIDRAIKEITEALFRINPEQGGWFFIIGSDHGNAESMIDPSTGGTLTEHTANDVIYYFVSPRLRQDISPLDVMSGKRTIQGMLADIAPTILDAFNIPKPPEMTGGSFLKNLLPPLQK